MSLFKKPKSSTPINEVQQIALAKVDAKHFGPLYEKYFETIFRFIFKRLGGNEAESGDLCQQTFIKAMANIDKYEDRGLNFVSWLYRIAQNEVNMFFRKQSKAYTVEIDERKFTGIIEEAGISGYMTQEEQEKLMDILNEMEQEQLDLIELRFFQELSFKEIADIYSITEANAKMRVYRILEKLQKKWNELKK
ncbi:MAG: sigma-70 family RNA polymerase sigma factor [Cryomorphaceae bacterium]|nr:sigma-70 family RNA polymerase sigma factor [Cryomorphaceae bacterium]